MTLAEQIANARERLDSAEKNGRFWVGMVDLFETMAAKWEEFSNEQFVREVEATKAQDMVDACKLEWKRAKVALNALLAQQQLKEAA